MTFDPLQDVMKILGVSPAFALDEVQFQRLSARLKEVSQFLDFMQPHAVRPVADAEQFVPEAAPARDD
jgi:hypothetical protein